MKLEKLLTVGQSALMSLVLAVSIYNLYYSIRYRDAISFNEMLAKAYCKLEYEHKR